MNKEIELLLKEQRSIDESIAQIRDQCQHDFIPTEGKIYSEQEYTMQYDVKNRCTKCGLIKTETKFI